MSQYLDLPFGQVAFHLYKKLQIIIVPRQFAKNPVDIVHLEDIVHQSKPERVVTFGQVSQVGANLFHRFRPELHGRGVQPAEGTVMLLAPPTPARGFIEDDRVFLQCGLGVDLFQLFEKIVVVGRSVLAELV